MDTRSKCRWWFKAKFAEFSKFPVECSPSEHIAWERHFEFFVADQGLRHTISPDAPEIAVISCTNNEYLFGQFDEDLVLEHRQVWGYISEATADAPFENSLHKCHSISDALRMMREWSLPLYPAERHLLVAELERVQFILRQFPERPSNPILLSSVVVFGTGGPWETESNERMTIWYLAAVACLSSSSSNGLAVVACLGSSNSRCNTGPATLACRGSRSCSSTGLAMVVCLSSNGLAAVGFLTSTNVGPMLSLPPGRRDNNYRCSNRHESLRSEVTGRTEVAPYLNLFLAVMAGLFRSGFSQKLWRCRCSPCWKNRSSRHRRPAVLFPWLHH